MARALILLEEGTHESLRYAALELRMCIESLTYEKLRSFSSMIPQSVLATWQPPQAVKALLEFEPSGDSTFEIHAGIEEEYGKPASKMKFVGRHNSLKLKWLRKHYNKLGNFLHAPNPTSNNLTDAASLKKYLNEVVRDLEEPLKSNILGGGFREVVSFECTKCKSQVVVNSKILEKKRQAICFNPDCKAEYFANITSDGQTSFVLMTTSFECSSESCDGLMTIENRKIDIGAKMICPICKLEHVVVERQWGYIAS